MKVRVHYWLGQTKDFEVPADILFSDFTTMAFNQGGKIKYVEFL